MKSIQSLFEVTRKEKSHIPKKYRKRLNRDCKHFKDVATILPRISHPNPGSEQFLADIESVKFYYANPSLKNRFLDVTDRSIEACFRVFCEESGIELEWKKIGKILDEVDSVLLNLKFEHMRPRPKYYLSKESEIYESIRDAKSPSFPSGHTTIAYFMANMLSDAYPESRPDFEMLAELIGQSRIENGVHFPSDVSAGKLIGQFLFDVYRANRDDNALIAKIKKNDYKRFANFLIKKSDNIHRSIEDLANFLHLTNLIENYSVPYSECHSASKKVHQGYPIDYITSDPYLKSVIQPMIYNYKVKKVDSPFKILSTHKHMLPNSLELGLPGEVRTHDHKSPAGFQYYDKDLIYDGLYEFCETTDQEPFLRHAFFEYIHPFSDGNGRVGRAILCNDLDYDFDKVNRLIGYDYIQRLNTCFEMFRNQH